MLNARLAHSEANNIINSLFTQTTECRFKKEICASKELTGSIYEIMAYFFKKNPSRKKIPLGR